METVDGANSVTVRMIREGVYTWSVAVAAEGNSEAEIRRAKEVAVEICRELEVDLRPELLLST